MLVLKNRAVCPQRACTSARIEERIQRSMSVTFETLSQGV